MSWAEAQCKIQGDKSYKPPKKVVVKKEVVKKEVKKVVKKVEEPPKIDFETINRNLNTVIKYLNSPSKKSFNDLSRITDKAGLTQSSIERMFQSQKLNDFYPTPKKCIIDAVEYIKDATNILEGTAGLGFVSTAMKEINPKANIDSIEYNKDMVMVGNALTENALNIKEGDFFKVPNEATYDHIFLNPPFTSIYSKKDNYYVKFVLKLLLILHETA
jgi:hypothetical protein